jgi:DNA-binding LacI/PurR family transcriptional regulator
MTETETGFGGGILATIYDIAKLCGFSPATVSKALSGASDVSVATRNKIRQAASRMDYIPDGRAKGLSKNRSWTIGILCQDGSQLGLRHYLFASILESFKNVVERHGYDIVFISIKWGRWVYPIMDTAAIGKRMVSSFLTLISHQKT